MTTTPAPDPRDQQIADLRAGLQRAIALLSYTAGRGAAADPAQAERAMAEAGRLEELLERTAP